MDRSSSGVDGATTTASRRRKSKLPTLRAAATAAVLCFASSRSFRAMIRYDQYDNSSVGNSSGRRRQSVMASNESDRSSWDYYYQTAVSSSLLTTSSVSQDTNETAQPATTADSDDAVGYNATEQPQERPPPILELRYEYQPSFHKKRLAKPKTRLKVQLPIFVLNLPKSGTLTLHRYFNCGMGSYWSAHHWMRKAATGDLIRIGLCMGRNDDPNNQSSSRPLVEDCGGYAVYTDAGAMWTEMEEPTNRTAGGRNKHRVQRCFFPGIHGLENIAKHYKSATIVHVKRNTSEWVRSAGNWNNILGRMSSSCNGGGIPKQEDPYQNNATAEHWMAFYDQYADNIRQFAARNPHLTLVEAELESPETPRILEQATGIDANCYAHTHKTSDLKAKKAKKKQQKKMAEAALQKGTEEKSAEPREIKPPKDPIFVLSLPTVANQQLHQYFECGYGSGSSAIKYVPKGDPNEGNQQNVPVIQLAECMAQNNFVNRPLVEGCGGGGNRPIAYVDTGAVFTSRTNQQRVCFFPGVHALENIGRYYPNSTIVHATTNNVWQWIRDVRSHKNLLAKIASACGVSSGGMDRDDRVHFPQGAAEQDNADWIQFYRNYTQSIRNFARSHPSINFVETQLDSMVGITTGGGGGGVSKALEEATGIPSSCYPSSSDKSNDRLAQQR